MLPQISRRLNTSNYDSIELLMIAAGIVIVVAVALVF
jgi:hypothetical protein